MTIYQPIVLPAYSGQRGQAYQHDRCEVSAAAHALIALGRARKLQRHIPTNARVFEYGVGQGFNLAQIKCRQKVGYDVAPALSVPLAERGITFVGDTTQLPDAEYDVVLCHHVLEHLPDPWGALKEMRRICKAEGTLLIFVPYEYEKKFRSFEPTDPNMHLFSWTPQTLGMLAHKAGLRVDSIGLVPYGYDRFAARLVDKVGLGFHAYAMIRGILRILRPHHEICAALKP